MSKYTLDDKCNIIKEFCLNEKESINPIEIANNMMKHESVDIHGPEHHILDGAAFLCAMHNAGVSFDLDDALKQMIQRGKKMPGAICGLWGVCGSASSVGSALSIINKTTYLSTESWSSNISYTSKALDRISSLSGPRCCKRNAYNSILTAIDFVNENYNIKLEKEKITCEFSPLNKECLKNNCPYNKDYDGALTFNI